MSHCHFEVTTHSWINLHKKDTSSHENSLKGCPTGTVTYGKYVRSGQGHSWPKVSTRRGQRNEDAAFVLEVLDFTTMTSQRGKIEKGLEGECAKGR